MISAHKKVKTHLKFNPHLYLVFLLQEKTCSLLLNYSRNQPSILSFWDGAYHILSIFRTDETFEIDVINMAQSISRIIDYIKNNPVDKKLPAKEFK